MTRLWKKAVAVVLLFLAVHSCNSPKNTAFEPLLPKADTKMTAYTINGSKGGTISHPSGTIISIPENAFVDAEGNPIKGPVEIEYREFHKASSVLASGIPMEYTENGETYSFQTAGMFEIKGYTKGVQTMQLVGGGQDGRNPVFIAEGKSLKAEIASFAGNEEEYNFYFFNEKTGQWEYREPAKPAIPNGRKQKALDQEAPMPTEPVKPKKFDASTPVLNLEVNTESFPELREFKGVVWEYAGQGEEQNPHTKENAAKLATTEWADVNIEPTTQIGIYKVIFSTNNGQDAFVTQLRPVLRGKNYERAIKRFEKKMESFQEAKTKRLLAEERRADEGNFLRMARINEFGIHNFDNYFTRNDLITVNAAFKLPSGEDIEGTIYMLASTDRALIKYPPAKWDEFRIAKNDALLVSILNDGKIAVVSRQSLREAEIKPNSKHEFVMEVEERVNSAEDLSEVISSLW